MADTRTIYLHTDDTTFTSDPTESDYTYLDMSEYDSLNPEYSSTIRVQDGVIGVYDDYDANITLTFTGRNSGRDERADWVNKYGHKIKQISVATTPTKSYVFNKSATVSSIEMIDTEFVNGAMVVINLTLFGRWQSSLNWQQTHTEEYSGGTKKYYMSYKIPDYTNSALSDFMYTDAAMLDNVEVAVSDDVVVENKTISKADQAYTDQSKASNITATFKVNYLPNLIDSKTNKYSYDYKYGSTIMRNQIELDPDKNRFIIVIEPNYKSGSITLANGKYSSTITSSNLSSTSGISSDFITYTTGLFDNTNKFTMLDRGYVASTVWNNISDEYAKLYSITNTLNTEPANINVTNEAGQHVPFRLYVYSVQDFI